METTIFERAPDLPCYYISSNAPRSGEFVKISDYNEALKKANANEALKKANANAEKFEREWYLRGDEIEKLQKLHDVVNEFMFVSDYNPVIKYWQNKFKEAMEPTQD